MLFVIPIRATFKGKNMLTMGSIYFSLIVEYFKSFSPLCSYALYHSKVRFSNITDSNIFRVCIDLLFIVLLKPKPYLAFLRQEFQWSMGVHPFIAYL